MQYFLVDFLVDSIRPLDIHIILVDSIRRFDSNRLILSTRKMQTVQGSPDLQRLQDSRLIILK